jgi:hypothetical protein
VSRKRYDWLHRSVSPMEDTGKEEIPVTPELALMLLRMVVDIIGVAAAKEALSREEVFRAKRAAILAEQLKFGPLTPS